MTAALKLYCPINLENYSLIIPSVSIGNVPQLAVDLIIATYKFKKVGMIWHSAIIPTVGRSADYENDADNCTACEFYVFEDAKIAVMQMRSGLESPIALQYFKDLRDMILHYKFKDTIILTSICATEIHEVKSDPFRYLASNDQNIFASEVKYIENNASLTGSGYATSLMKILAESVPTTVLIKYVSEGDNRPDAMMMVELLRRNMTSLQELKNKIEIPIPWQFVFGNCAPLQIY